MTRSENSWIFIYGHIASRKCYFKQLKFYCIRVLFSSRKLDIFIVDKINTFDTESTTYIVNQNQC